MYRIPIGMLVLSLACDQPSVTEDPPEESTSGAPDPAGDSGGYGGGADTSDSSNPGDDTAVADGGSSGGTDTGSGDGGADSGSQDTGTVEPEPDMMANFTMEDLNPTSPRYGEMVSPRDYMEEVSGWYFIKGS